MKPQLHENAYQTEIDQIVGDLFRTMLATDACPTNEAPVHGEDVITALMAFAGPWKGDLVLECHRPQAHCFAKRFLQADDLPESSEDVAGTIAELSNIIAGNLKVFLPAGVSIGTPSIIEGSNYTVHICGGRVIHDRAFATDAGIFLLRLIEDEKHGEGEA